MHLFELLKFRIEAFLNPRGVLQKKYDSFKNLLVYDSQALNLIADLDELFYGRKLADRHLAGMLQDRLSDAVYGMVLELQKMHPYKFRDLPENFHRIDSDARSSILLPPASINHPYTLPASVAGNFPDLCGGKAANLGRVHAMGDVEVPDGFVITAAAFHYFIKYNGFQEDLEKRLCRMEVGKRSLLASLTLEMQELILDGEVPPDLASEIQSGLEKYLKGAQKLAVRSSALAEDSEISFAGQYASELNIRPENVLDAYKRVLAGKYCPRAVSYRISNGLTDSDTAMAALVIPMIDAVSAGVVYSVDPDCLNRDSVGIYGVKGLGSSLVDGSVVPSKAFLSREDIPRLVRECAFDSSSLPGEDTLVELAACAMRLEKHFGTPQDVEWAVDPSGVFHILQTRPLQREHGQAAVEHPPVIAAMPVLDGLERASSGAGCGEIYYARTGEEIACIPEGSVVVTPTLKPALLTFSGNINAVLSESGSRASHFASVAREMGIPVLVGDVMNRFEQGCLVTVDGVAGAVYDGCVEDVLTRSCKDAEVSSRVLDLYKGMIPSLVRLNLIDPAAKEFSPQGCRSMHDLVRYCHEQAVNEMFSLIDKRGLGMGAAKRLVTGLPLVIYIIDLERGLASEAGKKKELLPGDIRCVPMLALWKGLADERVEWSDELTHVDWEEFDRISAGIFTKDSKILASYGVLAEDYLHLLVRFGYHLSEVDSLCGSDAGQNYIKFRFKGGGAGLDNRLLRLEFIEGVLAHYGFEIQTRGDMLDAFSSRLSAAETARQLSVLGYLMAVTRLMDMRMDSGEHVKDEIARFIAAFGEIDV